MQLQEGDIVEILGKKFVVLKIDSDAEIIPWGEAPIHPWIEKLTLMEVRDDRKAG